MAIRTYDFIFGNKTTSYHTQAIFKDRVTQEKLNTPLELISFIGKELGLMRSQSVLELSSDAEVTLSNIDLTIKKIESIGTGDISEQLTNLRELFATLRYTGYNLFLFERQDLDTDVDFAGITGYCYYADSDMVSNMSNVAMTWGIDLTDAQKADISSVVMSFIGNTIRFNDITNDLLGMQSRINSFDALKKINSGYMYDVSSLVEFCDEVGYKFQIVY